MMEKVDLVLMGAEGVVESGGIINKVSIELLQLVNDESFQQHSTDSKSDLIMTSVQSFPLAHKLR